MERHVGVVGRLAAMVRVSHCDERLDELASDGYLGLVEAAQRFDAGRGVGFGSFAKHRVHGAIVDGIRARRFTRRSSMTASVMSLEVPIAPDVVLMDLIEDPGPTPEELLEREYPEVYPALDALNDQQRLVVGMTFWQDMTAAEIGRVMMISEARVHQIKHAAMGRLRSELTR